MRKLSKSDVVTPELTAEQVALLLTALEKHQHVHPVEADFICVKLREAVRRAQEAK